MIENKSVADAPKELYPLKRHYYPLWIKVFGLSILIIFLYTMPKFFLYEYPSYDKFYSQISLANDYFNNKNYVEALELYDDILDKHPDFKLMKIMAAKSAFALSFQDKSLYALGLNYLVGESFKREERRDMEAFIPTQYVENFKSQFSWSGR